MSTTSTRLLVGFVAGFLSHLIFQGAFGALLYAAHLLPALPWSLMPVPPLGVPRSCGIGLLRRPASECGRLCRGAGAHGRGDRRRRVLMLPSLRSSSS
jgi:hypothetical protein